MQPKFQDGEMSYTRLLAIVCLSAAPESEWLDNDLRDREIDPVFSHYNETL